MQNPDTLTNWANWAIWPLIIYNNTCLYIQKLYIYNNDYLISVLNLIMLMTAESAYIHKYTGSSRAYHCNISFSIILYARTKSPWTDFIFISVVQKSIEYCNIIYFHFILYIKMWMKLQSYSHCWATNQSNKRIHVLLVQYWYVALFY